MSDHDLHLLTGAYAADALDSEERDTFRRHLETCAVCRQEVAELTATAARLALAAAEPAPAGMRERVLAEVARTRQLSPVVSDLGARRAARPWYRAPATAAAAVLLVVATGLGGLAVVEAPQRRRRPAGRVADRLDRRRPRSGGADRDASGRRHRHRDRGGRSRVLPRQRPAVAAGRTCLPAVADPRSGVDVGRRPRTRRRGDRSAARRRSGRRGRSDGGAGVRVGPADDRARLPRHDGLSG